MRLTRPRFTVLWLMASIVVVAIPMAVAAELGRRRVEYLSRVAYHTERGKIPGGCVFSGVFHFRGPKTDLMATKSWAEIDYRAEMVEKYRYAASHPWLPVRPDPPVPK
jgi:hypothetical protein